MAFVLAYTALDRLFAIPRSVAFGQTAIAKSSLKDPFSLLLQCFCSEGFAKL